MLSQKRFKEVMRDKNLRPYIVKTHIWPEGKYLTLGLLKDSRPIKILTCIMPYDVGVKIIDEGRKTGRNS